MYAAASYMVHAEPKRVLGMMYLYRDDDVTIP